MCFVSAVESTYEVWQLYFKSWMSSKIRELERMNEIIEEWDRWVSLVWKTVKCCTFPGESMYHVSWLSLKDISIVKSMGSNRRIPGWKKRKRKSFFHIYVKYDSQSISTIFCGPSVEFLGAIRMWKMNQSHWRKIKEIRSYKGMKRGGMLCSTVLIF